MTCNQRSVNQLNRQFRHECLYPLTNNVNIYLYYDNCRYLPCFQRMQGIAKNLPLSLKLFSIQAAVHWLQRKLREAYLHVQWHWFFLVLNFLSFSLYRNLKNWFNQRRFLLSNKTFIFFWEEETVKDGKEFHLPVLLVAGSSS